MKKNKVLTPGKIVGLASIGIITAALIGGNIACMAYDGVITQVLCGTGVSFEGEEVAKSQALGDELCREIGRDGIVLLKNQVDTNGNVTLPLNENLKKVNVFGWGATDDGFLLKGIGSGSSTINPDKSVTFLQGLEEFGVEYNKDVIDAYKNLKFNRSWSANGCYNLNDPSEEFYTQDMINQAKSFSNTAIIVVSRNAGENVGEIPTYQTLVTQNGQTTDNTRTYLDTTKHEEYLIKMASENFSKVILIVNSSNTMHLTCLEDDKVDAALYVGLTGQSAAASIANILWGYRLDEDGNKVLLSPSGKTVDTYSFEPETNPSFVNYLKDNNNIQYVEDIYYGYKWYETAYVEGYWNSVDNEYGKGYDGVVQYPFGYGLSYTTFDWEITKLSLPEGSEISRYTEFEVSVDVTNTGNYPGKDIVQLYVTPPYYEGGIEKAHVNLVSFAKTQVLQPGQTQNVTLKFNAYDFASYDCYDKNKNGNARYELDEGDYQIKLMSDAHNLKQCLDSSLTEENNVITYKVPTGGIKYNLDPKTKQIVKNRMTGETAYSGVPIDGSTVGIEATYLSRKDDFANVPVSRAKNPTNVNLVNKAATYFNPIYDNYEMPITNVDAGLRLVTKEDGSPASKADLNGETGAKLVINEELFTELSKFNSEKWEPFLNQLSVEEICRLVESGGFHTEAAESIGKPKAFDADGPAGFNQNVLSVGESKTKWTAYPCENLIGCSWNAELTYRLGLSMGVEAQATNISGWYAPGVNLHRSPYNARNYEYYSEDGVLSGKLAAEVIRGAKINGLYCYLKHFVLSEPGQNAFGLKTWITEQNLRENYMKPFEIAVKEGDANAIMSAFNHVGANWSGASYPVVSQILRTEWGFRGTVITDYSTGGAVGGMNQSQGVRAGNDFWLNPNSTSAHPLDRTNKTDIYCARKAVKNMVYTFVETYTYAKTHDAGADDRYSAEVGIKVQDAVFAWWKPVLFTIDGVSVLLMLLAVFLMFKKKPALITDNGTEVVVDIDKKRDTYLKKKEKLQQKINKLQSKLDQLLSELNELE